MINHIPRSKNCHIFLIMIASTKDSRKTSLPYGTKGDNTKWHKSSTILP